MAKHAGHKLLARPSAGCGQKETEIALLGWGKWLPCGKWFAVHPTVRGRGFEPGAARNGQGEAEEKRWRTLFQVGKTSSPGKKPAVYLTLRGRGFEPGAVRNGQAEAEGTTAGWWDGSGTQGESGNNRRANGVAQVRTVLSLEGWIPYIFFSHIASNSLPPPPALAPGGEFASV
jgi:hypothetical protein